MALRNYNTVMLFIFTTLLCAAGAADAGVLDPVIALATDVFADVGTLISIIGGIAIVIGVIAMMFGAGNAWKIAVVGVLIVIGANAGDIVSAITGL